MLEQLGEAPDLAVLFDWRSWLVAPRTWPMPSGCCSGSGRRGHGGVGAGREPRGRGPPRWCCSRPRGGGRLRSGRDGARAVRFDARREGEGWRLIGLDDIATDGATLILLADPFSFPVDGFLEELARRAPELTVIGGLASAANGSGGNRLVADDVVISHGVVGLYLPPGLPVRAVVSQGCRPVGEPFVITRARDNLIEEIADGRFLDRLLETAEAASASRIAPSWRGSRSGSCSTSERSPSVRVDFLIRSVPALDRDRCGGGGYDVAVGSTVQFQV